MLSMVAVKKFSVNQVLILHQQENVLVKEVLIIQYRVYLKSILDINECIQKPNPCKLGERCDNTPGSYRCVQTFACSSGLEMKDLQCLGKVQKILDDYLT